MIKPFRKLLLVAALLIVTVTAFAQRRRGRGGGEAELAKPFMGITTGGKIETGLFKIQSSGVSTKPVVEAANAFLSGISEEQRTRTKYPVDDLEWRKWDNRHFINDKALASMR